MRHFEEFDLMSKPIMFEETHHSMVDHENTTFWNDMGVHFLLTFFTFKCDVGNLWLCRRGNMCRWFWILDLWRWVGDEFSLTCQTSVT